MKLLTILKNEWTPIILGAVVSLAALACDAWPGGVVFVLFAGIAAVKFFVPDELA